MYLLVAGDAKTNKANLCQREIYNRSGNDNIQGGRTICERILLLVSLRADREHGRRLTRVQKPEGSYRSGLKYRAGFHFLEGTGELKKNLKQKVSDMSDANSLGHRQGL